MKNTILRLKHGVTLAEQDGRLGLSLAGHTKFAKNPWQAIILRTLTEQAQPLESLTSTSPTRNGSKPDEAMAALEMAAFILDFDYYIKS